MKKTSKVLSVFLALIMIISIIPMSTITASAEDSATSGTCGENLTWTFDEATGTLTIEGTGAMKNYYSNGPWESYQDSILSVIIKNGVTTIGNYAFAWCGSFTSVTIPDSVTTIGDDAFYGCNSLTSVTIPDSVTIIGDSAFFGIDNLTSVTIPNSVTTIGYSAFGWCDSLTSVTIPDSVTTIGDEAFNGCDNLSSVTIGDGLTTFGSAVFEACFSLVSITVDSNNQYYSSNEDGVLFNKDKTTLIQYPIGNTRTSYIIPDGVKTIGDDAFTSSNSLTSVTIPNSVTKIGDDAFYGCDSLTSITIPDSVTTIGNYAFNSSDSLTTVTIGDSVTTIGKNVFYACKSLTSIIVDSNNQYYSNDEYGVLFNKDKTALIQYPAGNTRTSYTIPYSVKTIVEFSFGACNSLTSVTIPDSVTTIDEWSFANCESLKSVTIPNSITSIVDNVFFSCESLKSVTIPDSVKTILEWAFYSCDSLTDVYYSGTEEQWNAISIGDFNHPLFNATIHYNHTGHICSFSEWTVVLEPTCTEAGSKTRTCECGNTEIEEIPATGHTAGEWETVLEPTYEAEGKKVKECTVCGEIVAEEIIPMLVRVTVADENTGVSMEYDQNDYNGEVEIVVEESFDGTAFDVIDTSLNASQKFIYDITMTVDGVETQPSGTVTVKIPLPDGYDPNRSFVYHVNTETGTVEKMPATYEDEYMVFETTHFSYYAVVEEYNYTFSIQEPSRTEIRNKDGIILHANIEGRAPAGSYVVWTSSNGNFDEDADGNNLTVIAENKGYTTFTATLYDANGNVLATDSVELYSKSGFFDKIGGFFRSLFGTTKIYEN